MKPRAADPDVPERLVLEPIGYVRCAAATKVQVARQPRAAAGVPARIELLAGRNFEHALEDLARWELIWVLFWFHRNPGWRPKVLPPRSTSGRKGVFATRSPHRPNPIGMSVVRLEEVEGLILHVRDADMLDGTPVLDLKPYVAYTDAHPGAGNGWLSDALPGGGAQPADPVPGYTVRFEPLALAPGRMDRGSHGPGRRGAHPLHTCARALTPPLPPDPAQRRGHAARGEGVARGLCRSRPRGMRASGGLRLPGLPAGGRRGGRGAAAAPRVPGALAAQVLMYAGRSPDRLRRPGGLCFWG